MITYLDEQGSFRLEHPERYSYLYFPLANEAGMKSSVTPRLGGDAKIDQNSFLLQPVSSMELHNQKATRNYWCSVQGKGIVSLTGASAAEEAAEMTGEVNQNQTILEAGIMWHKLIRHMPAFGLKSEILSFVPDSEDTVELTLVSVTNKTDEPLTIELTAAIPVYGRSADNIRDHRHVTSLLHRIETTKEGVVVFPTFTFDERGHKKNNLSYFVYGVERPVGFYPTIDSFIGEGGSLAAPKAFYQGTPVKAGVKEAGEEALGGLVFAKRTLLPKETMTYATISGIAQMGNELSVYERYDTIEKIEQAFQTTKENWLRKMNVTFHTGEERFDRFLYWVCFQPMLRRIYGCSFLPHHDYGKGGRGWRDLWQDCLALLMMNPSGVREMLLGNYAGVRLDGTNATIIGTKPGEFKADRNNIQRVWMDHGVWPYMTTEFYIHQTGDIAILPEEVDYFEGGKGTVLEHILVQNLTAFYEVGEHNQLRLLNADWNDALDMAAERGESVAFSAAYAGNLKKLSELLSQWETLSNIKTVLLSEGVMKLLSENEVLFESVEKKQALLKEYRLQATKKQEKQEITISELAGKLEAMATWMLEHIRKAEWLKEGWFNGYYDNHGRRVEGSFPNGVRMMLTSQVFTIMSGAATREQVEKIISSADTFLYQEDLGGYRLNTDFHEIKDDLGRMFGFAYGQKENGAVFSHMTTMYGNALYQRGFAKEGYQALHTLFQASDHFDSSVIYPGIPEYFNAKGRGMYHYLTGAASWYMMTVVSEMFGVKGNFGNLCFEPKLLREQFDRKKQAKISLTFAERDLEIIYENPQDLTYGEYKISEASCDNTILEKACLTREALQKLSAGHTHTIKITLNK